MKSDDFFEGDLLYRTDAAFLVENEVRITHFDRVACLDIETDARGGTDPKNAANMRIYVISIRGRDGQVGTFYEENEAETIKKAVKFLQNYGVIVAHNGREFDFPVLKKRCEILAIPVMWEEWVFVDSEDAHEFMLRIHEDSYSLDYLARKYLHEGKAPFDASKTHEAWAIPEGREAMARYCEQDVKLLAGLDAYFHYSDIFYRICDLTHCPPAAYVWRPAEDDLKSTKFVAMEEKPSPYNSSILADCAILYESRRSVPEVQWPTKPSRDVVEQRKKDIKEKRLRLPGGQTIRAQPGLYTNVIVLDYDSLYPRVLISMNLGPESVDPDGDIKGIPGRFKSEPETVVVKMAKKVLAMRDDVKVRRAAAEKAGDKTLESTLKAESDALKIVANTATYGVFGAATTREFNPLIQANIIFGARAVVNYLTKEIARRGMYFIYGDTDSLFIGVTPAQFNFESADQLAKDLTKAANDALREKHGCKNPAVKLKVEEMNSAIFFRKIKSGDKAAKKSYAMRMLKRDGAYEKSNIPILEVAAMKAYYAKALELGTTEGADEVLTPIREETLAGKRDADALEWVRLRKVDYGKRKPAQVIAHETLKKFGAAPEPGEPVGILILGKGKARHRIAARRLDGAVQMYTDEGRIEGLSQADREEAVRKFIDSVPALAEDSEEEDDD
jgi:DNA polymerase elongation subunit (family B)